MVHQSSGPRAAAPAHSGSVAQRHGLAASVARSGQPTPLLDSPTPKGGTPIRYAEEVRFKRPLPERFGRLPALLSVTSLAAMALLSALLGWQLLNPAAAGALPWPAFLGPLTTDLPQAAWTWLPFAFAAFGAGLGGLFELGLILSGTPFQQRRNRFTRLIQSIRFWNLAPVLGSILFAVISLTSEAPDARLAALLAVVALSSGLSFALLFGGAERPAGLTAIGIQLLQVGLLLVFALPLGGSQAFWFLIAQSVLQLGALVVGTATPLRSTGFHVLASLSGAMLYAALRLVVNAEPGFSASRAVELPSGSLVLWGTLAAALAGVALVARTFPLTRGNFRALASNAIWSLPNFLLVSNPRFPSPKPLGELYRKHPPEVVGLAPYYQVHPEFLIQSLSIPEQTALTRPVSVFEQLVATVRRVFKLIEQVDHVFPQANVEIPITQKPRMAIWSDGEEYWPALFRKNLFGRTVPGNGQLERAPEPAVEAYRRGQLLGYLCESGIGSPFLRQCPDRATGVLELDLRYLEGYETKPDYESYGGRAFFRIDAPTRQLVLTSVIGSESCEEHPANPHDPSFRHAESQVLASLYFDVVSGKHLAEIHMTFNIVEVTMHNAFDAQGQFNHPFRSFMYLHLFAHGLAETLTTEHLLQEGAVFAQIFATTQDGLTRHLNDTFSRFEYGSDEDFETRAALMTVDGQLLPKSAIRWELCYAEVWEDYTRRLVDIIYEDDAAVLDDRHLQEFHAALSTTLVNGLPERYDAFRTRAGVARYASDTIHHMVVRHQVYGTTAVRAALDPRINKTQVPRDMGTLPVDEWRSLAGVALATGRARYVLLMDDFRYLLRDVDERFRGPMKAVFVDLQRKLEGLDQEWTADEQERRFNEDYFRPVPSALHTGAGY